MLRVSKHFPIFILCVVVLFLFQYKRKGKKKKTLWVYKIQIIGGGDAFYQGPCFPLTDIRLVLAFETKDAESFEKTKL